MMYRGIEDVENYMKIFSQEIQEIDKMIEYLLNRNMFDYVEYGWSGCTIATHKNKFRLNNNEVYFGFTFQDVNIKDNSDMNFENEVKNNEYQKIIVCYLDNNEESETEILYTKGIYSKYKDKILSLYETTTKEKYNNFSSLIKSYTKFGRKTKIDSILNKEREL